MIGQTPQTPERKWVHDFRNAFNCLRLCTAAIAVCPEKGEQLEMLDEVILSAERAIDMLNTLPAGLVLEMDAEVSEPSEPTAKAIPA